MRRPDLRTSNYIVGLFVDSRAYDDLPIDDVIATAIHADDDDARWACIRALQDRGGPHIFDAAVTLCGSEAPRERDVGVAILGQNLVEDKSFRIAALPVLLAVAAREHDPGVLVTLCGALAEPEDARTIAPFSRWAGHPDPTVRLGVAQGLLQYEDERAIAVLIALMSDEQADVRDWATFGIGTQIDADSPTIRAALVARLGDPHDDTRAEAFAGLARRRDRRVVEPLLRELQSDEVGSLAIEAARDIGYPRLYAALIALREWWDVDTALLEEAIERCRAK